MAPSFMERDLEVKEKLEYFRDNPVESIRSNWAVLSAFTIFLIALYLRYMPAQSMKYLQALDPYWIFRQSQHLALEGNIPAVDFMRYFPYDAPFHVFNNGEIIVPALLYRLGGFLFFDSYMGWAQFFPALMGALGVFTAYFLGKELYDKYAGVSAAFFLATVPGVLHRTSAGFFEKEPVGTFFMMLSLYFFTRAWKRKEHYSGILSGLSLGFFTISWGGSNMLWILYPAVVGIVMLLNEDIEKLVTAYTPTVLIGGSFAFILNPGRFSMTDSLFLMNIALVGFLWSRYLVEELDLMEKENIPYYTPGMSLLGLIILFLSPFYSSFIATRFYSIIGTISRGSGGTIAGTVAENQAASLGQIISQLGAESSGNIVSQLQLPNAVLGLIGNGTAAVSTITGSWALGYIGIVFAGTYVSAMVMRKLDFIEKEIDNKDYHSLMIGVVFVWSLIFAAVFQGNILRAIAPSILALVGGLGIIHAVKYEKTIEIEFKWYHILPLLWAVTNIIAAVSSSRLIFLSAFPVAFMAGYAFSRAVKTLADLDVESSTYLGAGGSLLLIDGLLLYAVTLYLPDLLLAGASILALNGVVIYMVEEKYGIDEFLESRNRLHMIVVPALILAIILTNFSAAYVNAGNLGGSPNSLWMENLEYMEENTEEGSVILSWWDYGYWFESIGRRAAIADGGNNGYYSNEGKINYPLAQFLSSKNPGNWTGFLDKHSVDYIVLDQSMIGKYAAVSQISRDSNEDFRQMLQLSTSRNIQNSLSVDSSNQTLVQFSRGGFSVYLPVNATRQGTEISSAPVIEAGNRGPINCMLTDEGRKTFDVEDPVQVPGRLFGSNQRQVDVCVAENPFNSIDRSLAGLQQGVARPARLVLMPEELSRTTFTRLYLMDGHGMEMVEKVPQGSPADFVKMWEVKGLE